MRTLFGRKHEIDKKEAIDKIMWCGLVLQQSQHNPGGEDVRPAFLRLLDYFDQDAEEEEEQQPGGIHRRELDYFDQDAEEDAGNEEVQAKKLKVTPFLT